MKSLTAAIFLCSAALVTGLLGCREEVIVTEIAPTEPEFYYRELPEASGVFRRFYSAGLTTEGLHYRGDYAKLQVRSPTDVENCVGTFDRSPVPVGSTLTATYEAGVIRLIPIGEGASICSDRFDYRLPLTHIDSAILIPAELDFRHTHFVLSGRYLFFPYGLRDDPQLHVAIIEAVVGGPFEPPTVRQIKRVVVEGVTLNDFAYGHYAVPAGAVLGASGVTGTHGTFLVDTTSRVSRAAEYRITNVFAYRNEHYGLHLTPDGTRELVTTTTGARWTPIADLGTQALRPVFTETTTGNLLAYYNDQILLVEFGPTSLRTIALSQREVAGHHITSVHQLDSILYVGTLSGIFYRRYEEALRDTVPR